VGDVSGNRGKKGLSSEDLRFLACASFFLALVILYLALRINCNLTYKPDPGVIARIDEVIHKDPVLANALRNNSYTITIVGVDAYPYLNTCIGAMKCYLREVTAEIRLKKPVYMVLYGPINEYYETQVIRVTVNFDKNTLVSYQNEPIGFTSP
jgi:hypothetical protein